MYRCVSINLDGIIYWDHTCMRAHSLLSVLLLHFCTMWRHQKVTESGYCTVLWLIWLFSVLNWLKLQLDLILKIFGRGQCKKGIKRYRFLRYIYSQPDWVLFFFIALKKNLCPLWKQTSEDQKKLLHVSYDVTLFQKLFFYTPNWPVAFAHCASNLSQRSENFGDCRQLFI